jgi:hypothetical protein
MVPLSKPQINRKIKKTTTNYSNRKCDRRCGMLRILQHRATRDVQDRMRKDIRSSTTKRGENKIMEKNIT